MANISGALMKLGGGALEKGSKKAIEKVANKAIEEVAKKAATKALAQATTKGITKSLTGAGVSSLSPKSGSTLDGILGRSSGIILPNAKKPTTTSLAKEYANTPLAKTAKQELAERADRNSKLLSNMDEDNDLSWDIADDIERGIKGYNQGDPLYEQLHEIATKQRIKPDIFDEEGYLSSERDSIDYNALTPQERADIAKNAADSEILRSDYDVPQLENEMDINPNQMRLIDQATKTPEERKIEITQPRTRKKNIDVALGNKEAKLEKPVSTMGVDEAVAETNTPIADFTPNVIEPKTATGGAGVGNGGGTPTATASPDYGGLGDSGFNVKLKNGENIDISLKQPMSKSEIKKSRAVRNLDDSWAKGLNATPTQYKDVVSKSKSAYKGYKTPAEMARMNGISLDNINETPQQVVNAFEKAKLNIEKYAEDRGVNVSLDNLDLSNIEPATKATMKMQGIDPDKIRYTGVASPTEAETLYKDLRNRANKTTDGDRAVAYNTMADYVRKQIDNTLDNLNIDFSYEMSNALGEALGKDADLRYLRDIANNKNLKFSDLRREQADWIKIGNLSGRPIKEGPTINVFGTDTGIPNPLASGAERLKEKFYERQAYGPGGSGGAGGNMGGGSVPPFGGSGAENNINFETVGGRTSNLSNLLNKAKSAGLVGAGVLGGMMLGGGGGGSNGGSTDFSAMSYNPYTETETEIDPYQTLTIGGYTYDQLEAGYTAALMAGDSDAAKLIANMISMLDDKVKRYQDAKENSSSGSGIAAKQKSALNVLSGLMNNYQAQGPIGGRFTGFMNALTGGGYNPAVAAYDSGASGSLGTIIKALGDTGALSEGDQRRALELLPKTTDSEEAAKYKYQQLIQILRGAGAQ